MMLPENFCYTKGDAKPVFETTSGVAFVPLANHSAIMAGLGILACAVHHWTPDTGSVCLSSDTTGNHSSQIANPLRKFHEKNISDRYPAGCPCSVGLQQERRCWGPCRRTGC